MKEKPFALIGVNYLDREPGELEAVIAKEKINWRTFDDQGEINRRWNFPATPTMYIIDHKGTIRRKWVGKIGQKTIDAVLDKLVDEAEQATTPT